MPTASLDTLLLGPEPPDNPWLRQVLLRRTQRRYSERPVPDALVRLLLAGGVSASSRHSQATPTRMAVPAQP